MKHLRGIATISICIGLFLYGVIFENQDLTIIGLLICFPWIGIELEIWHWRERRKMKEVSP